MPRQRRSQPRTSKSRRTIDVSDEEGWYKIRSILDERLVNGYVEYLVDWDDNKETGQVYSPTWSREVTEAAYDEWKQQKRPHATESRARDSQDSQPPRPSNWRQLQRSQAARPSRASRRRRSTPDEVDICRPAKVARTAYSATPSEEPVPSIVSISSPVSLDDSDGPDCLGRRILDAKPSHRLFIELQAKPDFDSSEYASQHNIQSSGQSSQSIAELEELDEWQLFASQLTRQTIPDSQEPSGQTWTPDKQVTEFAPSSQGEAFEDQDETQPQTHSQHASPNEESSSPSHHQNCSRSRDENEAYSNQYNTDIPSNQLGQAETQLLFTSKDFDLTAATKPHSAPSPLRDEILTSIPTSCPVFLSQVVATALNLPESSAFSQASPTKSAVAETPSYTKQNSACPSSLTTGFAAASRDATQDESQDAQVFAIDPFISHVKAFSDSHDTIDAASSSVLDIPHIVSHLSPAPQSKFAMENQDTDEPANPTPRPSAVDELSQILNLDKVMAESPSHPPDEKCAEHSGPSDIPTVSTSTQDQHRQHSPAFGPQSEQIDYDIPLASQVSAVASMKSIVDAIFENPDLPVSSTRAPDASCNSQQEVSTISLADITNQPDLAAPLPLMPSLLSHDNHSSGDMERSGVSVSMGQPQQGRESDDDSDDGSQEPIALKHIITLPFQASLRPLYDDTLLESKREVTQFGAVFNSEDYVEPDDTLVQKIDKVFSRLHNICDYPPDALGSTLEDLPSGQLIKYCYDANPKINFIYEFLQGLTKETRVLIVARSLELLRLLYRLTEALEIECVCKEIGKPKSQFTSSIARATLILPGNDIEENDFDVVIGYDHCFGESEVGKKLEAEIPVARSPMVLILVTTHSIEHIDLYISDDLTPLERRNALLSGIVRSRQLVSDPDRGYPEPHELASLFLDYLNGQVEEISWEPIPIPEEVMDIYLNSQSRSQLPVEGSPEPGNARKRKLDESDDEDVKRMRILSHRQSTLQTNEAPVPDDVKAFLESANIENTHLRASHVHISVPISVLQVLAEQNAELKRQLEVADRDAEYKSLIAGLETRIKEYERTNAKIYSSQRRALEDRIKFKRETIKAESNLVRAKEVAQRDAEKAEKKITDLEAIVVNLTANPLNTEEPSPLFKTHTLLQESLDKIALLEKRLDNARKEADYARSLYQDATATFSALRGENADLSEQVTELSKTKAETLSKVHQIQADSTIKTYLGQIRNLRTQLRQRELELEYTKEELRTLKNGRRETRQVSVPRSPRMGMMSPRTGRATYGSAAGSTSRGTSPAPTSAENAGMHAGMQFLGQPPNGRWQHLRD
ncbi:Chromo domain-like protein [Metarhizium rileyi]|uniref:Chromo domain-like protein n=1 Tax=Metarhizium rileyi (strain RCEF 4871) TaxID=1649241 RepID=A0A167BRR6_METRR|nr:Chromo domain-like protein [Metarhizium rileyi RCEF 4871]